MLIFFSLPILLCPWLVIFVQTEKKDVHEIYAHWLVDFISMIGFGFHQLLDFFTESCTVWIYLWYACALPPILRWCRHNSCHDLLCCTAVVPLWPPADPPYATRVHMTPGKFIFLCKIAVFHHICTPKVCFKCVMAPWVHPGSKYSSSATGCGPIWGCHIHKFIPRGAR